MCRRRRKACTIPELAVHGRLQQAVAAIRPVQPPFLPCRVEQAQGQAAETLAGKSNSSRLAAPPKRRIRFDVPGNSSQSLLPASNSLSHRLATSQDPTIKSKSLIVITFLYRKSPRAL